MASSRHVGVGARGPTTTITATMFHGLGFMQAMVGIALGSTLVVRRRFDPEATLDSLADHHASAMVVVPVMLRRLVDLGEEEIQQRDLSPLKIISSAALRSERSCAVRW